MPLPQRRAMADRDHGRARAAAPSARRRPRPPPARRATAVASSMNSQSGLKTSARAIARRCCSPPDSMLLQCASSSSRPASWPSWAACSAATISASRRRRLLVGILHRVAQGADRDVGLLRQEQHARARRDVSRGPCRTARCRPARGTACSCPSRWRPRSASRWPLGSSIRASCSSAWPLGSASVRPSARDILAAGLRHDVERRRRLVVGRRLQALEAIHHRAQLGERGVVVDEERQRRLHLAEGRGGLGHHAEGDGAGEEARRRHDDRGR